MRWRDPKRERPREGDFVAILYGLDADPGMSPQPSDARISFGPVKYGEHRAWIEAGHEWGVDDIWWPRPTWGRDPVYRWMPWEEFPKWEGE